MSSLKISAFIFYFFLCPMTQDPVRVAYICLFSITAATLSALTWVIFIMHFLSSVIKSDFRLARDGKRPSQSERELWPTQMTSARTQGFFSRCSVFQIALDQRSWFKIRNSEESSVSLRNPSTRCRIKRSL